MSAASNIEELFIGETHPGARITVYPDYIELDAFEANDGPREFPPKVERDLRRELGRSNVNDLIAVFKYTPETLDSVLDRAEQVAEQTRPRCYACKYNKPCDAHADDGELMADGDRTRFNPYYVTPGDRVRALADLGPVVRLPTGLPTLDRSCRGGLPTRRFVVVGGAPGAGKTTLVTSWGWSWARAGIPVAFLAIDEGPEGSIARIAQLEGINPDLLEERDPDTLERLADMIDETPLMIFDGDDDDGTIEAVVEQLAKCPASKPRVLIVDSLQTVRTRAANDTDGPRERVDRVVNALKAARDAHGFLVITTCELARGAYRSKATAEQINDLAAFKESGGIEYAAQTALVLRSVPNEPNLVDVAVPKNRAYKRDAFRLQLDSVTTAFVEVGLPEESPASVELARVDRTRRARMADARILENVIARNPGIGERALRATLKAAGHGWGPDRIEAVKLCARVENRGTETKSAWYLRVLEVESDE